MCLLILPIVFHVLINRHVTCPNHIWSCDVFDNQALARSCAIFPGSHAVRSRDMLGTGRSCDKSHDRSGDRFPWSHVLRITRLELGLGAVVKQFVIVEWVLGSFGNAFLVGMSFACNSQYIGIPESSPFRKMTWIFVSVELTSVIVISTIPEPHQPHQDSTFGTHTFSEADL